MPSKPLVFEGWENQPERIYRRESKDGHRAVVGTFDGWNWGYLILDPKGVVLCGVMNSQINVFDAISQGEFAFGEYLP